MQPIVQELRKHFDRIVVIGLHRIDAFYEALGCEYYQGGVYDDHGRPCPIQLFPAIDARKCKPPPHWKDIPSLWACGESHRQVIARALSDGVRRLFIMEDDCRWIPDCGKAFTDAFNDLPSDWDGFMAGGQVSVNDGETTSVTGRLSHCVQVERLHAYGLSHKGMQKFHDVLCESQYKTIANDYAWGDAQQRGDLNVYRIEPFIAYQCDGRSSISGRIEANRAWDDRTNEQIRLRRPEDVPVISLVCPFDVLLKLRQEGIVTNGGEAPVFTEVRMKDRVERGERQIAELMFNTFEDDPARGELAVAQLRSDATFHRDQPLALWHPTAFIPFEGSCAQIEAHSFEDAKMKIGESGVIA
jgi:hypothetical protein